MPLVVIVLVLILISIYFLFPLSNQKDKQSYGDNSESLSSGNSPEAQPDTGQGTDNNNATGQANDSLANDNSLSHSETARSQPGTDSGQPDTNSSTEVPGDRNCTQKAANIDIFFQHLDTQKYIQTFDLGETSSIYFPKLIQRLVDQPPVVTGETDDLFTILQNTAHFFRIIGKKNILILKGILDRERATFEQTLADFYRLTLAPACLQEHFDLQVRPDSMYLYSGFFLNTMGGRLYLFRRDSMSRMVVNFYAIQILEQANRQGRNKYGIEIKSAIDNLISEIESTKIELKMREYYLDTLYDLKEKYQ